MYLGTFDQDALFEIPKFPTKTMLERNSFLQPNLIECANHLTRRPHVQQLLANTKQT